MREHSCHLGCRVVIPAFVGDEVERILQLCHLALYRIAAAVRQGAPFLDGLVALLVEARELTDLAERHARELQVPDEPYPIEVFRGEHADAAFGAPDARHHPIRFMPSSPSPDINPLTYAAHLAKPVLDLSWQLMKCPTLPLIIGWYSLGGGGFRTPFPTSERNMMTNDQPGYQPSASNQEAPEAPPQTPPAAASASTSGMAIAGLVLGIVAIVTSFLPIINNISFFIGTLGAIFAIIGIVGTGKGKKRGRGLAIAGFVVGILSIVIVLASQAFYSAVIDEALSSTKAKPAASAQAAGNQSAASAAGATDASGASGATADSAYGLSIDKVAKTTDYQGNPVLLVDFIFTNNSTEDATFSINVDCKAFQNGVQLDTAYGDWDSGDSLKSIKTGGTVTVQRGYALDDASPVTIEASETFDLSNELILQETYDVA